MESVMPGGLGDLGGGALGGAVDIPKFDNPMAAPDAPTRQADQTPPSFPTSPF